MKKNSLLSLMMASAVLLSSCSSIIDSGYIGYKKNEMKYGKEVARQFKSAILLTKATPHNSANKLSQIKLNA